ncbi:MAG: glucan biosynthesis protein G [Nevskiales bacterium]
MFAPLILARRAALAACLLTLPTLAQAFGFPDVAQRAKAQAAEAFRSPDGQSPDELLELSYDQYRDIRFKPDRSIWRKDKLPFEIQLFHPGFIYNRPVQINLITDDKPRRLPFNPLDFDYRTNRLSRDDLQNVGFAGLRVHYRLNRPDIVDEVLVFQGASYLRALGRGQRYGLSARGVAVDTALRSGEEFPFFKEFWIEQPQDDDRELTFYALLDSPSMTGAYQFRLRPGTETELRVRARLFMRKSVDKLGLAPLTSMFYYGENQRGPHPDYRPEVHDSDGLLIHTDEDEWIWRPLVNPRRLLVTSFALKNPRGFGVMQRDHNFANYEDLEARYELRPSAWIRPEGDWGPGRVELVLIPTPDETNDNIVAYWVPEAPATAGQIVDIEYRLGWQMKKLAQPPDAWVAQTRIGAWPMREPDDRLRVALDFTGPALAQFKGGAEPTARIWASENGEILEQQSFRNEVTGGWRVSFVMRRKTAGEPVELRAHLQHNSKMISETWSYILPP